MNHPGEHSLISYAFKMREIFLAELGEMWQSEWRLLSRVWLFVTPWTTQYMEFSRPEYWSGFPFPSPEDLPNPGIEPRSPILQVDSLLSEPQGYWSG